jgi:hypothetical protein
VWSTTLLEGEQANVNFCSFAYANVRPAPGRLTPRWPHISADSVSYEHQA